MANGDQVAGHHLTIDQALVNSAEDAFLPIRERDLYNLDPQLTVLGGTGSSILGSYLPGLQSGGTGPEIHHGLPSPQGDPNQDLSGCQTVPHQQPADGATPGLQNLESLHSGIWFGK